MNSEYLPTGSSYNTLAVVSPSRNYALPSFTSLQWARGSLLSLPLFFLFLSLFSFSSWSVARINPPSQNMLGTGRVWVVVKSVVSYRVLPNPRSSPR
jgi:hypothetical protein